MPIFGQWSYTNFDNYQHFRMKQTLDESIGLNFIINIISVDSVAKRPP